MSIGYVSIILSVPKMQLKTCILKNANSENIIKLIDGNLSMLDKILDYNIAHGLYLYRISSGIIPFASHPINTLKWNVIFKKQFENLGKKIKENHLRVSMHPGQYTLLNSPNKSFVEKSFLDLDYHAKVLDAMGLNFSHKLILHIGGIYGNKKEAIKRFVKNYKLLPQNIKKRLVIENDDKNYTVKDVLYISKKTGAPVVFDYLHHILNHSDNTNFIKLIKSCRKTWKKKDGIQKVHYSQQAQNKRAGSHSQTIDPCEFCKFYNQLPQPIDVMLEVKDKDISALKCISYLSNQHQ